MSLLVIQYTALLLLKRVCFCEILYLKAKVSNK